MSEEQREPVKIYELGDGVYTVKVLSDGVWKIVAKVDVRGFGNQGAKVESWDLVTVPAGNYHAEYQPPTGTGSKTWEFTRDATQPELTFPIAPVSGVEWKRWTHVTTVTHET
jgi:hypothetical protein